MPKQLKAEKKYARKPERKRFVFVKDKNKHAWTNWCVGNKEEAKFIVSEAWKKRRSTPTWSSSAIPDARNELLSALDSYSKTVDLQKQQTIRSIMASL